MSGMNAEPNEYATTAADQATFDDAEPETLQATGKEELEALKDYVMQTRTQLPQDSEIQNL